MLKRPQEGENNFHAFYQLLKGAPKNQLDKLHLKNELSHYRYLGGGPRGGGSGGKAQLPQKVRSYFDTSSPKCYLPYLTFDP